MSTVTISIIGTGLLGTSLGLALKRIPTAPLTLLGYDSEGKHAADALQAGAIERTFFNLPAAVETADLVVLAVPQTAVLPVLEIIAPIIKSGCVITDTAPFKAATLAWVRQHLPAERYYVASRPVLNPAVLHSGHTGPTAARADLYDHSLWAITPDPDLPPGAIKLVADVAKLAGSKPFFVDAAEHDDLLAVTEALPTALAALLVRTASAQPEWSEARKLAGRTFATASVAATLSDPAAQAALLLGQSPALIAALTSARAELDALITTLTHHDRVALEALLSHAADERTRWFSQREDNDWSLEESFELQMPTSAERLNQVVGGKLLDDFMKGNAKPPGL